MKNISIESYKKKSGIYQIVNLINNKLYVGSAINIYLRYYEHLSGLSHNRHHSPRLQHSYNKHGKDNFLFSLIELCSKELLIEREQHWIDFYKSYLPEFGYNIYKIAYSALGFKHTKETRRKMMIVGKNKPINPKAIKAMQLANTGRRSSPECIRNTSLRFSKPVIQLTLDGKFVKEWESSIEATLFFGAKGNDSNIAACTRGKCRSARGFLWVKKSEYDPNKEYRYKNNRGNNSIKVYQYSLDEEFIKEWDSANVAAEAINVNSQGIYNCVWGKNKTCKGYKWYRTKIK